MMTNGIYSEKVMDHFANPRNVGSMEDANGIGEVGNAKCGDIMRIYLKVNPDTDVIEDVKFMTYGCGCLLYTSRLCRGKTVGGTAYSNGGETRAG